MTSPILAALTEADRAAVLNAARVRKFAKGEVVFHEGDPAEALHIVVSGHFAVQVVTPDGDRATLNILGAGASVGELALLRHQSPHTRSASVIALEASETRVLTRQAFHQLCETHPAVEGLLVVLLADRVRDLSAKLVETMYVGLDRRVYRCLLDMLDIFRVDDDLTVPLTQEHLADLVGGTRPSVNQVLQKLVSQGIVELGRGRVVVRDVDALTRKAQR